MYLNYTLIYVYSCKEQGGYSYYSSTGLNLRCEAGLWSVELKI